MYTSRQLTRYSLRCFKEHSAVKLFFYTFKHDILLCGCQITANTFFSTADPAKIFGQTGLLYRGKWVLEGMLNVP